MFTGWWIVVCTLKVFGSAPKLSPFLQFFPLILCSTSMCSHGAAWLPKLRTVRRRRATAGSAVSPIVTAHGVDAHGTVPKTAADASASACSTVGHSMWRACSLIRHYFYWPHIILLRPRRQGIGHHSHTHSPSPFIGIESNQIAEEPNFMFG